MATCQVYIDRGTQLSFEDYDGIDSLQADLESQPQCSMQVCNAIAKQSPATAFNVCCRSKDPPDADICDTWANDGFTYEQAATVIIGGAVVGFGIGDRANAWLSNKLRLQRAARQERSLRERAERNNITVEEQRDADAQMNAAIDAAIERNASGQSDATQTETQPSAFPSDDPDYQPMDDDDFADLDQVFPDTGYKAAQSNRQVQAAMDLRLERDEATSFTPVFDESEPVRVEPVTPVASPEIDAVRSNLPATVSPERFDNLVRQYAQFPPDQISDALEQTEGHAGLAKRILDASSPRSPLSQRTGTESMRVSGFSVGNVPESNRPPTSPRNAELRARLTARREARAATQTASIENTEATSTTMSPRPNPSNQRDRRFTYDATGRAVGIADYWPKPKTTVEQQYQDTLSIQRREAANRRTGRTTSPERDMDMAFRHGAE